MRGCACRGTAGFAHVSCLAEQAKILREEAEENNLSIKVKKERWNRWYACSLCEQQYHGVVRCALGWACWKTYVGRPETDLSRRSAITQLGNGLTAASHHKDALSVREAELAVKRRIGVSEHSILVVQSNLANTYTMLGRPEEALRMRKDTYSRTSNLMGEEHRETLHEACNYALSLLSLKHLEEAKSLFRKVIPVARRVQGDNDEKTIRMRWYFAVALSQDEGASLDDLREAITTLEDTGRIAQRVLGGVHPTTVKIEHSLPEARAVLAARESGDALRDALGAMKAA